MTSLFFYLFPKSVVFIEPWFFQKLVQFIQWFSIRATVAKRSFVSVEQKLSIKKIEKKISCNAGSFCPIKIPFQDEKR